MVKQNTKTTSKKNRVILVLTAVFALLVCLMILALCLPQSKRSKFTPPPFEENAESGLPDVPSELGYSSPYKEGMSYRFSVCGNVMSEGKDAIVYLTNPAENTVWLKMRVLDESGKILGETGLLRPGEYVRSVTLSDLPEAGTKIILKIMGYEPETYQSAGSARLSTTMGGAAN